MNMAKSNFFSKRLMPIALAVLVLFTSTGLLNVGAFAASSPPSSITVSYSHGKSYISGVSNSKFSAAGGIAYCMNKGYKYTSSNKKFSNPKECPSDINTIMNLGYPNNSAKKIAELVGVKSLTADQARAATQMALWSCGYGTDIKINDRSPGTASGSAKVLKAAKWLYKNRTDKDANTVQFYYYSNGNNTHQSFIFSVGEETSSLTFMKISKAPDVTEKNPYYGSLTDVRFKLYEGSASGTLVGNLKVKKAKLSTVFDVDPDMDLDDIDDLDNATKKLLEKCGITDMDDIVYYCDVEDDDLRGDNDFESGQKYTLVETEVPNGFKKTANVSFTMDKGNNIVVVANDPIYGQINLKKDSGNKPISDDNKCYSLKGAVYQVKGAESYNSSVVRTITTDENGSAKTPAELPLGKYTVKETKPSPGYAIDPKAYDVTLTAKDAVDNVVTKNVTSIEIPQNDPAEIVLKKIDSETLKNAPQGAASLADAEFTIRYFDGYYSSPAQAEASGEPTRTWTFKTDSDGFVNIQDKEYFVTGSALYLNTRGYVTFPLGTVLIQETKAPKGYLIDNTVHVRQITGDGKVETVHTYTSPTSIEQVYRGDLELTKIGDTNHKRLANVPFKMTSGTTGETHTMVTDENGYASTNSKWNPHTHNTNKGETSEDGIWFSMNHDGNGNYFDESKPDNDKGALIYDTYLIEEQRCESNKDYELIPAFEVRIYKDSHTVNLGTLTNDAPLLPEIGTTAKDAESGGKTLVTDPEAKIIDTVSHKNLKVDEEYVLKGILMDKASGKPLLINGEEVTTQMAFTPKKTDGSVDMEFAFDATSLGGIDIVVFEYLYKDDDEVATHTDIDDKGQTVKVVTPKIGTKATDKKDGDQVIDPTKNVTIVDTVEYTNLIPGKEYIIKGKLMDKSTNKPLLINDKEVTAEKKFTPVKSDGSVKLEFKFDASTLAGKDIVVFEDLYRGDALITSHADIDDKDQTVKVGEVPTKEKDSGSPSGGGAKTGDGFKLWTLILLALASAGGLIAKIIISRKAAA